MLFSVAYSGVIDCGPVVQRSACPLEVMFPVEPTSAIPHTLIKTVHTENHSTDVSVKQAITGSEPWIKFLSIKQEGIHLPYC